MLNFILFSFSLPVAPEIQESHEKTMKNNGKPSKTKENEKQMKLQMQKKWKFGLKVADSHSEPGNLQKRGNFHFFIIFIFLSFSLPVAPEIQESHEKQWKTMENHQKQRKMKKNEVANEKNHENLDSKLQILTPNQEIFKNEENVHFFSFFIMFFLIVFIIFFSFSLPVAPEIQESHEKTMKNNGKPSKTKENEKNMKLQMKKMKLQMKKMKLQMKKWR